MVYRTHSAIISVMRNLKLTFFPKHYLCGQVVLGPRIPKKNKNPGTNNLQVMDIVSLYLKI